MVRERFGVDEDVCTGDHACIRLSGCPSLSVKQTDDPLKDDPVAAIDNSCVGCGNCGEVAEAAVLCPSFYRADIIYNPTGWDRAMARLRAAVIGCLQRRRAARRVGFAVEAAMTRHDSTSTSADPAVCRQADLGSPSSPWAARAAACWPTGSSALAEARGLDRAVDLGARRRPAHRRDDLLRRDAAQGAPGKTPILSLMPTPGDVDVVIAAELMEAGRSILRGLVTPDRTTLIASTHRAFAVSEKETPGRRHRRSAWRSSDAADLAARAHHRLRHGGAGRDERQRHLRRPCSVRSPAPAPCRSRATLIEATIRAGGKGAEASLRASRRGLRARGGQSARPVAARRTARRYLRSLPRPVGHRGPRPALTDMRHERLSRRSCMPCCAPGSQQVVDFQDSAYGDEYLDRLSQAAGARPANGGEAKAFAFTVKPRKISRRSPWPMTT